MTAALLAHLTARGVTLAAEGDRLRVRAPVGVLTPEFRAEIAAHKPALLALLRGQGGPNRADAEAPPAPPSWPDSVPAGSAEERALLARVVPIYAALRQASRTRRRCGTGWPAQREQDARDAIARITARAARRRLMRTAQVPDAGQESAA